MKRVYELVKNNRFKMFTSRISPSFTINTNFMPNRKMPFGAVNLTSKADSFERTTKSNPTSSLIESLPKEVRQELKNENDFLTFLDKIKNSSDFRKQHNIGNGANSAVYEIPQLENYALKVVNSNKQDPNGIPIGAIDSKINLGQPVWQSSEKPNIYILKKITGQPYSINNWSKTLWDPEKNSPQAVTKEQAEHYYSNLVKVSQMEQSAYDDLAQQIKTLDTILKSKNDVHPGFKIDCINPNNLIVDFSKNKMHIIDYFGKTSDYHKNSAFDMLAVISDFALLPEYADKLEKNKSENLVRLLKEVEQKSLIAAQNVGLSTNINDFTDYINETSRWFKPAMLKDESNSKEYVRLYDKRIDGLFTLLKPTQK